jgi:hypothetical protein
MEYGETKKVNLYFISTIYGVHFFFFFASHVVAPTAQKGGTRILACPLPRRRANWCYTTGALNTTTDADAKGWLQLQLR